jgi:hypothetical protein
MAGKIDYMVALCDISTIRLLAEPSLAQMGPGHPVTLGPPLPFLSPHPPSLPIPSLFIPLTFPFTPLFLSPSPIYMPSPPLLSFPPKPLPSPFRGVYNLRKILHARVCVLAHFGNKQHQFATPGFVPVNLSI